MTTPISFDPTSAQFRENPYEFYSALRSSASAHPYEHHGRRYWFISRYPDVRSAVLDTRTYTSTHGDLLIDTATRTGKTLGTTDPPRHDQLRRVFNKAFTAPKIASIEREVRQHAKELAEECRSRRQFELVNDFARPYFNRAIGRIIGLRDEDRSAVLKLIADVQSESSAFGAPIKFSAIPALAEFMLNETQLREGGRAGDLISTLLEARAENEFATDEEIALASTMVVLAGFSTVVHFLGNLLAALHRHPAECRRVVEDLGLLPTVIEEGARYDTAGQAFARTCMQDVQIGDTWLPEGSRVVLLYASANRDSYLTPSPDQFVLSRPKVNHLGFGAGPHFCLGAQLARFTLRIALEELLPVLGANFDLDYASATRPIHFQLRGFDHLIVRF